MSINTLLYKEILREYDNIREESQKNLKLKQDYIYKNLPNIRKIDEQLYLNGIAITKSIINNPDKANELILDLQNKNNQLIEKKTEILIKNGYKKNYLKLEYLCPLCKDTGYIDNKICKCMEQKLIDKAYIQSNLKNVLKYENFSTFDKSYYSDELEENKTKSPLQNMELILKTCVKFCDDFDKKYENLILFGKTGLGKTFLSHCIAKELLDKGKTVLYFTAVQLFQMAENERFGKDNNEYQYLDTVLSVDLLIIDDLGTEMNTLFTNSELYNIINLRLLEQKPTIINSNLDPSDLINIYSDRITSRIQGNYTSLKLSGKDIRIIKKYKG